MVNGSLRIAVIGDAALDAYYDIRAQAFGRPESERAEWCDRVQRDVDSVRLGAYLGTELVGGLRVLPGAQWLNGRSVPMGAVAAAVVRPEFRNRGVARSLLFAGLDWMREQGIAVSSLHPASTRVYRSTGWEIAGMQETVLVDVRSLAALRGLTDSGENAVVRLGPQDWETVRACYARAAASRHGFVDRSESFWNLREPASDDTDWFTYGVRRRVGHDDGLAGYVRYRQRAGDGWRYRLVVDDIVAATPTVARALWRFLGAHAMQVEPIEVHHACVDQLLLLLDEQDLVSRYPNRWMFRIVDLAAAVAGRGYPGDRNGSIEIDVEDPWPGGCSGRWRISVEAIDGRATRIDAHGSAVGAADRVSTDIGALSALMIGRFTASTLAGAGRMGGSPAALATLDSLLASPTPQMDDDF